MPKDSSHPHCLFSSPSSRAASFLDGNQASSCMEMGFAVESIGERISQSLFRMNFCTDTTESGKTCGIRVPPSCSIGTMPVFSSPLDYLKAKRDF